MPVRNPAKSVECPNPRDDRKIARDDATTPVKPANMPFRPDNDPNPGRDGQLPNQKPDPTNETEPLTMLEGADRFPSKPAPDSSDPNSPPPPPSEPA